MDSVQGGRLNHFGLIAVRPENPNQQLKFLTFAQAMIILERCIVLYPLTARDKVCDHATRRLCPPRLYLSLVPVKGQERARRV